ncbi:MAG: hypothetical protein K0R82_1024 [Flavipsychrobacter sp.]|jgi:hypothetical protein|nr:hypothetical protein [Flavipsychrobacter sp.]
MIDLSGTALTKLSVHYVGNKGLGQEIVVSKKPQDLHDRDKAIIKDSFLSKFQEKPELFSFHHLTSLDYNEVYNYCLDALAETKDFHKKSASIAKHLHEATTHPKIKPGELYVCYFENSSVNGAFVDAIGIFKTETRTNFFDLNIEDSEIRGELKEGIDLGKFDKACLVFPTNAEKGFDVLIHDSNRGEEAVFWRETFLSVMPQANEYFQTNQFLNLTKQFIAKQIPQEFDMEKADQIDLLNKSVEYFRSNESFNKKDFEKTVFEDGGLIKSFRQFGESYSEANDFELPERFDISTPAVKKQARIFKSVLKLDKNFHIYIHGDRDLIEKGYDAAVGKHYYKIYFEEEA